MATKKTSTPAPAKKPTPAKNTASTKAAPKAAAPTKKAEPAKKPAPAKAPAKKAEPAKKPAPAKAPAKKAEPAKKPTPAKAPAKAAEPAKKPAPAKTPAKAAEPSSEPQPKQEGKKESKPAPKKASATLKDSERERIKKFKATIAQLRAEPGWKAFLAEQKKLLLELRDHLLPNMQNVTRDHLRSGDSNVSSSSGQHIGDAGSEAEQRDITILRLDKDREQLFEIDAALQRIEKGTYGICEISLEPIPRKRLQVRPFCRLTVKCQEEYEKKYGSFSNYRSKNSGDVGFSGLQKVIESTIMLDEDEE